MEVRLDFVSSDMLAGKGRIEKIDFIIERIKKNIIVVLEQGLDPVEEAELIEASMREIDAKDFHGIEFYRIDHRSERLRDRIAEYIAGRRSGLTIVGPTRMVEAIKKEKDYVSMLARGAARKRKAKEKASAPGKEKKQEAGQLQEQGQEPAKPLGGGDAP